MQGLGKHWFFLLRQPELWEISETCLCFAQIQPSVKFDLVSFVPMIQGAVHSLHHVMKNASVGGVSKKQNLCEVWYNKIERERIIESSCILKKIYMDLRPCGRYKWITDFGRGRDCYIRFCLCASGVIIIKVYNVSLGRNRSWACHNILNYLLWTPSAVRITNLQS